MTSPAPTPNNMPGAATASPAPVFLEPTAPAVTPPTAPAPPAPAAQPPAAAPAAPPAAPQADIPPWEANGEPFDPERAWNLIQNLRTENGDAKSKLAAAQPILDAAEQQRRAKQDALTTAQEDIATANKRGDAWRDRAIRAEARELAGGRFIDADAALALIGDLSGFATDDNVDTAKLQQRFDQLAADKPNLVAAPATTQGFTPNRGQGQSGNGPLTPAQVAAHAESQQDWKAAGAAKAQQLIDLRQQMA
ncbi:hypothetical protein A5722_30905 [Mycobacterium vulneris]|nr:hypothetical protein A5722_30905 [Mycolicibacterium vulneris]OCB64560.1 hypothetical protein A5729_19860 [Mycolicibacterium vulneris]